MEVLEVAKRAATQAGAGLLTHFRAGLAMTYKADCNPVSIADLQAQATIAEIISAAFPQHSILSEEGLDQQLDQEHLWILDPLDGTTNFLHGLDQFAVSIAYYYRGQAAAGVVYMPARGEWFVASRGGGAFHNGKRVNVSASAELTQALIGFGFYYDRGQMMEDTLSALRVLFQQHPGVRRFGAASVDLCYLGAGYLDVFFEYTLYPWDFAAARLFLEAGGRITTTTGEPLPLKKTCVLASNSLLHEAVMPLIARASSV